ncbi:MAG: energy-coupling factor transporter ATPase [Oscillospiraceae bacterium]|nr:energy-coupling factor transporter ATPase [Oscillospiraceae bacterium]
MLEFHNVSFAYPALDENTQVSPAVQNLSFNIAQGEFVAMLGHNGSGKSTVAKLCNGLLAPDSGQVLLNGLDTSIEDNLFDIRRQIGMVFQNPDNQIIAAIVEDDVAFGPENLCVPPAEIRTRVDDALAQVGMSDFATAEPHKLSGGQKQRVAIAGVLAMQTQMIVLDESTAMLDPRGRQEVMDTVIQLHRQGKTVLLITHFMEEAMQADRVLVMHNGSLIAQGSPREVFAQRDVLLQAGLTLPAAARFAQAAGLGDDILTEDECVNAILTKYTNH